jgi:hypothetical protein
MAPKDVACIAARREEVQAVRVLHAELHKAVTALIEKSHGLVGNMQQPEADREQQVGIIRKLAGLIHLQKTPDVLSQESWRTLNAVSAVVLKQVSEERTSFNHVENAAEGCPCSFSTKNSDWWAERAGGGC